MNTHYDRVHLSSQIRTNVIKGKGFFLFSKHLMVIQLKWIRVGVLFQHPPTNRFKVRLCVTFIVVTPVILCELLFFLLLKSRVGLKLYYTVKRVNAKVF